MIGHLIPFKSQSAANAYAEVLKTTEFNSAFTETITPRAIALFEQFATIDIKGVAENSMDNLMSYARHHYTEQKAVIEAAGNAICSRAQATSEYDVKSVTALITKLIDTAAITGDHLEEAFTASWATIANIHPAQTNDCHCIIYRTYGVADRSGTLEQYLQAGRDALPAIVRQNKNNAVLAARALEQASIQIATGERLAHTDNKPFITPAFARTGELSGEQESRWFFPSQGGRGEDAVITLVPGLFDGATQELSVPKDLSERDSTSILHIRRAFTDVVNGIIPAARAAERIGSPAPHLALKAWQ